MKEYEKKIVSMLLEMAGERFSNHGCNDTPKELLDLMTEEERNELDLNLAKWNGEPEEYTKGKPYFITYDWMLFNYFSEMLKDN